MRERGGEVSDAFMLNLMEHQVVRIEVSDIPPKWREV